MSGARLVAICASFALAGCWLALDLEDKEFTLGDAGGRSAGAPATTSSTGGDHSGMVRMTPNGAPPFYIDATEVTVSAYAAWLATNPQASQQEARCAWNDSFAPGQCEPGSPCGCDGTGITLEGEIAISPSLPVRCVDFCDAVAYCAGVGKHLCGGQQGVVLYGSPEPSNSAAQSEWYFACSNGGTRAFPYGDQFAPQTCEESSQVANVRPRDVGAPACEGGIAGLFDMSGNVEEWVDHSLLHDGDRYGVLLPSRRRLLARHRRLARLPSVVGAVHPDRGPIAGDGFSLLRRSVKHRRGWRIADFTVAAAPPFGRPVDRKNGS